MHQKTVIIIISIFFSRICQEEMNKTLFNYASDYFWESENIWYLIATSSSMARIVSFIKPTIPCHKIIRIDFNYDDIYDALAPRSRDTARWIIGHLWTCPLFDFMLAMGGNRMYNVEICCPSSLLSSRNVFLDNI